jgi:heat shock protein HslJ
MILRVLILTLLLSINAYAKSIHHTSKHPQNNTVSVKEPQAPKGDINKQLADHNWQITQVIKQAEFSLGDDRWVFNFAANGKYKAFGTCNFLSGSYKTDEAGMFRVSNLDGSNNSCGDEKDEEAIIFNMLLLADSFEINGDALILKSSGQALMELRTSNKEVSSSVAHTIKGENSVKSSHKKKEKTMAKKSKKTKAKSSSKRIQKDHTKVEAKKR